jgi:hypothetical protein
MKTAPVEPRRMTHMYLWRQRIVYVYSKFLHILEGSVPHLTHYLVGRVSLAWQSIHFTMFKNSFYKLFLLPVLVDGLCYQASLWPGCLIDKIAISSPDGYFREFLNL